MNSMDQVRDLIFGRWKSQTVHAGVALGVFDELGTAGEKSAKELADCLQLCPELLSRLLRALASLSLLQERGGRFVPTEMGRLLQTNTAGSLRYMVLLEEGQEHYAIWSHLVGMIRDGKQNAFMREYGQMAFEYAHSNRDYGSTFKRAMSSFSSSQSKLALEAMKGANLGGLKLMCDVAGGQGHLLCSILSAYDHLEGVVFDLPEVVDDSDELWGPKMGLQERCQYVSGDMFEDVPEADGYLLKMILHDWNDRECVKILRNLRRRVSAGGKVFIIEHIVPNDDSPHFSKLYDIHMMCWGSGRERSEAEYSDLLSEAGWALPTVHYPASRLMGVIEAVAS